MRPARRTLIATLLSAPALLALPRRAPAAEPPSLALTPSCDDDHDEPTLQQTAGPYYKDASPQRRNLRADVDRGEPMALAGLVLDTRCAPIAGARVEIWHANADGSYDTKGFRLRGHQVTDAAGRWAFDTIVTRHYAQRTAHYHFRVSRPGLPALITQIYFPDEPRNARDRMFDARLLMRTERRAGYMSGRYDFVLPTDARYT